MYHLAMLKTPLVLTTQLSTYLATAQKIITAGDLAPADQTYDLSSDNRCRLLAHQSVELKTDKSHILLVDNGFGTFRITQNGTEVHVTDLNPWTTGWDLSKDFATPGLEPLWMIKKSNRTNGPPVVNHGGLWVSDDGKTVWAQGGHFYNATQWNPSQYHVDKVNIPPWQLWQLDIDRYALGWGDVTNSTKGHEFANRTFAGGAVSVPSAKKSFWLGGLLDPTTSSTSPNTTLATTDQMLIFDQTTKTVSRQKYYDSSTKDGVYQGKLIHLPIGSKSGYLMSLMSLEKTLNTPWLDVDGPDGNKELGDPISLDTIPLYDIETNTWFEQKTSWYMNQIPEPRTRFCSALFRDTVDGTWELWIHGGQKLSDQNTGVREIYVLSMPSFIWTKLDTTLQDTNLIRSHTCHAIGGQLLIVGGYPPGLVEGANVTCDPEYLKVLTISETGVAWTGEYKANSVYRSPQTIRNVVNARQTPIAGFVNQKLQDDFTFSKPHKSGNVRYIAGGVVGGIVLLAFMGVFIWLWRRRRAAKKRAGREIGPGPSSPRYGQPEVIADGNVQEVGQHPSSTVVEMIIHDRRGQGTHELGTHELESPISPIVARAHFK